MILKDVDDPKLKQLLQTYEEKGGKLKFSIVEISDAGDEYECHFQTALHTLKTIKAEIEAYYEKVFREHPSLNKYQRFSMIYIEDFRTTGIKITPAQFFGPYLDIDTNRVIVHGRMPTKDGNVSFYDSYYYHTDKELPENKIERDIRQSDSEFITEGYTDAFLEPPKFDTETMLQAGEYFLNSNRYLFSDFQKLIIYKWSIDCSNIFDAGKEYQGSFFWTVYNPIKDWYVGIVASWTD